MPAAPALAKIPDLPKLPDLPSLPAAQGHSPEPATEAYARTARGATSCWFGAGGQLKKTHIFYADADPPSTGGKAEIALLERTGIPETPRGAKAYRITFLPEGGGTKLEYTNHKMSEGMVAALQADVVRFVRGDLECAKSGPTAPQIEAPVAAPATPPRTRTTRQAAILKK